MLSKRSKDKWIKQIKLGMSLEYASSAAKEDFDIVLVAMKKNGLNLKYAGEKLKSDPTIVKVAVGQNYKALDFVKSGLKKKIVENGINSLETENIKENEDLDKLLELVSTCETEEDVDMILDTLSNNDLPQSERLMIGRKIIRLLEEQIEISKQIETLQNRLLVLTPSCEKLAVFPVNEKGKAFGEEKKFSL